MEGLLQEFVTIVDQEGSIQYQSPSIKDLLGYEPGTLNGERFLDFVHPDDRQAVLSLFNSLTDSSWSGTARLEYRFRQFDGSWAWLESMWSYHRHGFVINSRSITQRKESRQQAAVLHRVLRHNLRNELTVILGAAETIIEESDHETVTKQAERILESSSTLNDIAEHTQVVGEFIESQYLQQQRHEVTTIIERIVTGLRENNPSVEFTTALSNEAEVTAPAYLDTAFEHVLENAVEHNDADTPEVEVRVEKTHSGEVKVIIADNGPGIPEHERAVLLEGEETPLQHGSGIGLWIVNWIITHAGGHITFDQRTPRGSRVTIALPVAD